eukprot:IDg21928t1
MDLPNIQKRRVNVVTAQSIRAHSKLMALQAGVIKNVSKSVKRGFRPESRKALRTRNDSPDAPSKFELLEHTTGDNLRIDKPGIAATFQDVCGDNDVAKIAQCATTLSPFLSKNSSKGRIVVAKVIRVHSFSEKNHSIYDIALLHSFGVNDDKKIDKLAP